MKNDIPQQYQRVSTTRKVKFVKINGKNKGIFDGPAEDVIVDTRLKASKRLSLTDDKPSLSIASARNAFYSGISSYLFVDLMYFITMM